MIFWDGVTRAISSKAADGTGEVKRLASEDTRDSGNPTMTPDGRTMALRVKTATNKGDIDILPLDGDGKLISLIHSPADESAPEISPDGSSLAYLSDESGRQEIDMTRFPSAEGKWQVSVSGGDIPRWGPRGTAHQLSPEALHPRHLRVRLLCFRAVRRRFRRKAVPRGEGEQPRRNHNWLADLHRSD